MSAREERVKIFEDTMDWINTDKDLSDSVNNVLISTNFDHSVR